ncbi:hypothetical protein VNI00_016424 [Paramarasmius palmivorus]|uniref:Uncharacterized protein n=1 Tax=Paramarasmius palmivorus TaxID=297713 RepID=A0AAW0BF76_9AGAR
MSDALTHLSVPRLVSSFYSSRSLIFILTGFFLDEIERVYALVDAHYTNLQAKYERELESNDVEIAYLKAQLEREQECRRMDILLKDDEIERLWGMAKRFLDVVEGAHEAEGSKSKRLLVSEILVVENIGPHNRNLLQLPPSPLPRLRNIEYAFVLRKTKLEHFTVESLSSFDLLLSDIVLPTAIASKLVVMGLIVTFIVVAGDVVSETIEDIKYDVDLAYKGTDTAIGRPSEKEQSSKLYHVEAFPNARNTYPSQPQSFPFTFSAFLAQESPTYSCANSSHSDPLLHEAGLPTGVADFPPSPLEAATGSLSDGSEATFIPATNVPTGISQFDFLQQGSPSTGRGSGAQNGPLLSDEAETANGPPSGFSYFPSSPTEAETDISLPPDLDNDNGFPGGGSFSTSFEATTGSVPEAAGDPFIPSTNQPTGLSEFDFLHSGSSTAWVPGAQNVSSETDGPHVHVGSIPESYLPTDADTGNVPTCGSGLPFSPTNVAEHSFTQDPDNISEFQSRSSSSFQPADIPNHSSFGDMSESVFHQHTSNHVPGISDYRPNHTESETWNPDGQHSLMSDYDADDDTSDDESVVSRQSVPQQFCNSHREDDYMSGGSRRRSDSPGSDMSLSEPYSGRSRSHQRHGSQTFSQRSSSSAIYSRSRSGSLVPSIPHQEQPFHSTEPGGEYTSMNEPHTSPSQAEFMQSQQYDSDDDSLFQFTRAYGSRSPTPTANRSASPTAIPDIAGNIDMEDEHPSSQSHPQVRDEYPSDVESVFADRERYYSRSPSPADDGQVPHIDTNSERRPEFGYGQEASSAPEVEMSIETEHGQTGPRTPELDMLVDDNDYRTPQGPVNSKKRKQPLYADDSEAESDSVDRLKYQHRPYPPQAPQSRSRDAECGPTGPDPSNVAFLQREIDWLFEECRTGGLKERVQKAIQSRDMEKYAMLGMLYAESGLLRENNKDEDALPPRKRAKTSRCPPITRTEAEEESSREEWPLPHPRDDDINVFYAAVRKEVNRLVRPNNAPLQTIMPQHRQGWERTRNGGPTIDHFTLELVSENVWNEWNKEACRVFIEAFIKVEGHENDSPEAVTYVFRNYLSSLRKELQNKAPLSGHPEEMQRERRVQRRRNICNRRVRQLRYRVKEKDNKASMAHLAGVAKYLTLDVNSGDESETVNNTQKYYVTNPEWRSPQLAHLLHCLSALHLEFKYHGNGKYDPGPFPAARHASDRRDTMFNAAPKKLPVNWYNPTWLNAVPGRQEELQVKPAASLHLPPHLEQLAGWFLHVKNRKTLPLAPGHPLVTSTYTP